MADLPEFLAQWQHTARFRFPLLAKPRAEDSHKGKFGTVAVIGSAVGMSGAGVLAATAALKGGAGKVWLGFAQNGLPLPYLPAYPEIMLATALQLLQRRDITVYAVGCGLGMSDGSRQLLEQATAAAIHADAPLLLDADALNMLAVERLFLPNNVVLTPHPLEAARLLDISVEEVQGNRYLAAAQIAERYGSYVVLKGANTVVCTPNGRIVYENDSGNPGLATAGSGDVLSGLLAALLAQQLPMQEAACAAVWLHGTAAELLAARGIGPIGLTAGEIADAARELRNLAAC
ncbi:NAD(P)H-hydrate dehydratase [Eikenella longinqua]|uniref:ADP-dependent (S)-NAD(P)H-hydrate dehydratase n=1 Tax=Eikenella longinqua TaxID=1795827 RepID=A0A1A9RY02_9NEIS|nr:NAD(P)H-hydrate dehydratase [Eikenella longinqua]OAM29168.1 NAD(P)H-hydrate dehydratase [Eikenella longinqua]